MSRIAKLAKVRVMVLTFFGALLLATALPIGPALAEDAWVDYGGSLRFNYFYKTWDGQEANQDKGGDIALDVFRIEADGGYGDLTMSAEYRFYAGYHMLHHGYVGWNYAEDYSLLFGVSQVPFGIQPYASHNWFFDVGYYIGLEDDYDLGLQHITRGENWDLKLAFFKNSEGHYTGNSLSSARYSYDAVPAMVPDPNSGAMITRSDDETNQFNGRYAYTFGEDNTTEIGLSGQYGMLYNYATENSGSHVAYAVHAVGNYGKFNVMASAMAYSYDLEEDPANDFAAGDFEAADFVAFGAYDAPYWIAAEGTAYLLNLSYTPGWGFGPFEYVSFYDNFSTLMKSPDGFEDTLQNVIGMAAGAGPLYVYFDVAMGQNHPWIGGSWSYGLAQGDPDADWETRFNINFGYYF